MTTSVAAVFGCHRTRTQPAAKIATVSADTSIPQLLNQFR